MDGTELNRLRWRCRRGMLENDLILERFLNARGGSVTGGEAALLDRLLDLGDSELWDLLSGRTEPDDAALRPLLAAMRRPSHPSKWEPRACDRVTAGEDQEALAYRSNTDDGLSPPSETTTKDGEQTSCQTAPRQ